MSWIDNLIERLPISGKVHAELQRQHSKLKQTCIQLDRENRELRNHVCIIDAPGATGD